VHLETDSAVNNQKLRDVTTDKCAEIASLRLTVTTVGRLDVECIIIFAEADNRAKND